jgi:arylsulfatase A-like enzyme
LKPPAGAPNVLLVMGDDIGFGHMSAFGGPARTPVFDRLAQHGLSYTRRAITWRPTWPTRRSAGSSDRSPSSPTSPGSPTTPRTGTSRRWIEKYLGEFDDGYNVLRDRILARQKELGIVSADTELSPWPEALPSWDELTDKDRMVGARWMEVFCGAVEHTDHQVGRIVEAVDQMGELDNTLVVFIAGDNGPTPDGDAQGMLVTMGGETVDSPSTCWRAYRRSSTTGSGESGTGSPRRNRCPRARRPSASTSPTTAAA